MPSRSKDQTDVWYVSLEDRKKTVKIPFLIKVLRREEVLSLPSIARQFKDENKILKI